MYLTAQQLLHALLLLSGETLQQIKLRARVHWSVLSTRVHYVRRAHMQKLGPHRAQTVLLGSRIWIAIQLLHVTNAPLGT